MNKEEEKITTYYLLLTSNYLFLIQNHNKY